MENEVKQSEEQKQESSARIESVILEVIVARQPKPTATEEHGKQAA